MKKSDAVNLLASEGWTKADAMRALEGTDFSKNPDELTIRRAVSPFSGAELINRQRLQAAQKGEVTKKNKKIEKKTQENADLESKVRILTSEKRELIESNGQLRRDSKDLIEVNNQLKKDNKNLIEVNDQLKRDNKDLKNLVDAIKLKLAIDVRQLMQYENSEIRKALAKWFKSTQG